MKREKYKVIVNSKAEARMYRKALLAIGEKVFKPFWEVYCNHADTYLHLNKDGYWCCAPFVFSIQTVTFKELIKLLVNEEVKTPLITTVDGVDLFEGDECWPVFKNTNWFLGRIGSVWNNSTVITHPDTAKAFHSKQAALDWCEEQNKPKEIEQALYFGQMAFINPNKSEIRIMDGDKEVSALSFGDVNDLQTNISNAIKQLNNENR